MINSLNIIAEKWFTWELVMFWQVGLLIVIVAGLDALIRKWAWPQVRFALWLLILVKLVLPPTLTSPMSFTAEIPFAVKKTLTNSELRTQNTEYRIQKVNSKSEILHRTHYGEDIPVLSNVEGLELSKIEIQNKPTAVKLLSLPATPAEICLSGKVYVLFVWLAGVVILSGWLIIRLSNLRHQYLKDKSQCLPERLHDLLESTARRLNLKKTPQVILTDKISCPAVFGVFRPVLLMPADKLQNLTRQDTENIFLHELAHIKRGDLFVHTIFMILQITYWFNPLLWLIRKPIQNLRELCCDATVARILQEKTADYRQTLLETARELLAVPVEPGLGLLGLFENSHWLVDRLGWLEKKSWKYRPLRIATIFVIVCLMTTCVLPMAKSEKAANFVIRGTVTDAQTEKPIAGAKVSDAENYAEGQFYTTTDTNGIYSYKTYYEEHNLKCQADGYKTENKTLLTKLFGNKKEKVMNFALEPDKTSVNSQNSSGSAEEEKTEAGLNPILQDTNPTLVRILQLARQLQQEAVHLYKLKTQNAPETEIKASENRIDELGEKIDEISHRWGRKLEKAGEQLAEKVETWAENFDEKYGDKFAARIENEIEAWSEKFSKQFEEQSGIAGQEEDRTVDQVNSRAGNKEKPQDTDLYIEDFKIEPYDAGGLYTVTVKIGNLGRKTAPAFRMNFFRGDSKYNINLHGKSQSGSHGAGPIKPGQFFSESSMPFALQEGLNQITVVLDIDNSIAETNKLNNTAAFAVLSENGKIIEKSSRQNKDAGNMDKSADGPVGQADKPFDPAQGGQAKALRITIYEGDSKEPQTSVHIPLAAMKIVRSILPSKDKLQLIAEKMELDKDLPEGLDSNSVIDMLDGLLAQVDTGLEATTLLEVKDGSERVIVELE